ncbi:MAG TPA: nuclear transport factor 2 family protein [Candidatus Angelobacter sp.]|nr:nuclear transport factor 2 family protein [Candidatus Angelobacter sp.]
MPHFTNIKTSPPFPLCVLVSFVVGLCFLLAGCAGEPKHPGWNISTGTEHHERLIWKAMQEKDWANVERRISATFVGVTADGQMFDRAAWLQHWKTSPVGEFSLGEMQVMPEGPDMKVTYILHLQTAGASAAPAAGLRVVSVWQQLKKGWILSATSITPISK